MCRSRFACSHNTVTRQLKDILGGKKTQTPNKQLRFYLLDMDDFVSPKIISTLFFLQD